MVAVVAVAAVVGGGGVVVYGNSALSRAPAVPQSHRQAGRRHDRPTDD